MNKLYSRTARLFLVTIRSEQLCTTHMEDGNWLWSPRKGLASIEARTHLGGCPDLLTN